MLLDALGRVPSRHLVRGGLAVLLACAALFAAAALSAERAEAAKFTRGYVTGTVYFSKGETAAITEGGPAATFTCGVAVPGPYKAACGGVVAWAVQANRAKNRDMCLKVKFALVPPNPSWPDIYGGNYCH
jgi:hypothetical protein